MKTTKEVLFHYRYRMTDSQLLAHDNTVDRLTSWTTKMRETLEKIASGTIPEIRQGTFAEKAQALAQRCLDTLD